MTFDDLVFGPHPIAPFEEGAIRAYVEFPNGFGVSVIGGTQMFHCDPGSNYEVMVRAESDHAEVMAKMLNIDLGEPLDRQWPEDITNLLQKLERL